MSLVPPTLSDAVELVTPRLMIRTPRAEDVPAIVRYYRDNADFLRPWEPARPASFFEPEFWHGQVWQTREDLREDRAVRLFLFSRADPGTAIGTVNFTAIVRGGSHSCTLGYGLSEHAQGQGLMREALEPAIEFMFRRMNMHRIQANYMPHNRRSGRLLRSLGFAVEGYARDYVQINGAWEDHVLTSRINEDWEE